MKCKMRYFSKIFMVMLAIGLMGNSALAEDWANLDINIAEPDLAGNTVYTPNATAPNEIVVTGGGSDIWGNADKFHYAYKSLSGDGMITARLTAFDGGTSDWMKSGVMIRESLDANAAFGMTVLQRGEGGISVIRRLVTGEGAGDHSWERHAYTLPTYLRTIRSGDTFSFYRSTDGVGWTKFPNDENIPMGQNVYAGLAVTAHNPGELEAVTFDNIDISNVIPPFVAGSSAALDFGLVSATGGVVTKVFTLNNPQKATVATINSITMAGSDFAVTGATKGGVAVTYPVTLDGDSGETIEITVSIDPTGKANGVYTGGLNVDTDAPVVGAPFAAVKALVTTVEVSPIIDGLILGFQADALSHLSDQAKVDYWPALSSSQEPRSGVQNNTNRQPVFVADALNGKPIVRFDGEATDGDRIEGVCPIEGMTQMTIMVVCANMANNSDDESAVIGWEEDGSWGRTAPIPRQENIEWRFGTSQGGNNRTWTRPDDIGVDFSITTFVKDDTEDRLYVNGELVITEGGMESALENVGDDYDIGGRNGRFGGDVAEILIFDRALNFGDHNAVGYYLEAKYGLEATYVDASSGLNVEPEVLDFGWVAPGDPAEIRTMRVTNDGTNGSILNVNVFPGDGSVYDIVSVVRSADPQPVPNAGYYATTLSKDDAEWLDVTVSFDGTKTPTGDIFKEKVWITHDSDLDPGPNTSFPMVASIGVPAQLPVTDGLVLNLDASNVVGGFDNAPAVGWYDSSGLENHGVQSNEALRPIYKATGMNGQPSLLFDGADDEFMTKFITESAQEDITIITVLKTTGYEGTGFLHKGNDSGWQSRERQWWLGNDGSNAEAETGLRPTQVGHGNDWAISDTDIEAGQPTILSFAWDTSALVAEWGINGALTGILPDRTPTASNSDLPGSVFWIGRGHPHNGLAFNGDIAAMIIYDKLLSDIEMNRVGHYLQTKYGITGNFIAPVEQPDIVADAASLTFPATPLNGASQTMALRVHNAGFDATPLTISSISIAGDEFSVGSVLQNDTLPLSTPFYSVLNAGVGDYIDVTVVFNPATVGDNTGNLRIESNDPDMAVLNIPLSALVDGPIGDHDWQSQDFADTGEAGSATFTPNATNPDSITLVSGGPDIWGNHDRGHYAYKQMAGNGMITARLVSYEGATQDWMKAGIMIRSSLDANAANGFRCVTAVPNPIASFQWRNGNGGNSGDNGNERPAYTLPHWMRLVRQGNTLTAYRSDDGENWVQFPTTANVDLGPNVFVGMTATPHVSGELVTINYDNISIETFDTYPQLYVNVAATGANTGLTWDDAFTDVAEAVRLSAKGGGGQIWVAGGVYDVAETMTMGDNVQILGGFNGGETDASERNPLVNGTILVCTGVNERVFYARDIDNMIIDGFVITGGNKTGNNEHADSGGAIALQFMDETSVIRNCYFTGNSSSPTRGGGAIAINDSQTGFTIENCVFAGNWAGDLGGAIYMSWTGATINNCLFTGNVTPGRGNVIAANPHYSDQPINVTNCTFANNSAVGAGSVVTFGDEANLNLTNCIFADNAQAQALIGQTEQSLINRDSCLFFNNISPTLTGAVIGGADITGDPLFATGSGDGWTGAWDSIAPGHASGAISVLTANGTPFAGVSVAGMVINLNTDRTTDTRQALIIANTDNTVTVVGNNADVTAGANFQIYDYSLKSGSPAIDAGVDAGLDADFIGVSRPQGLGSDIGAFERLAEQHIIVSPDDMIQFGSAMINGAGKVVPVTITNDGSLPINFTSFVISGLDSAEFTFETTPDTTALAPESVRTVNIVLTPTVQGIRQALLTITTTVPGQETIEIALYGSGIFGDPPAAPTALDLADADDTGASNSDNITMNTTGLTISGTAEANTTISIKDGATVVGAGTDVEFAAGIDITLAEGVHTLTATATALGVESSASGALSVTVDATAPTLALASTSPEPTTATPIPVTATFSEVVTGFEIGDVVVVNGTAGNFAGSDAAYTFDVTPIVGAVTVDVAAAAAMDTAGNASEAAATLTRNFSLPLYYDLTVEIEGNGTVDPTGGNYLEGTEVILTATPTAGNVFVGWTGAVTSTDTTATVTMDGNKAVTATFASITYTLNVTSNGDGTVASVPDQSIFSPGETVELTAIATDPLTQEFKGWTGDVDPAKASDNPLILIMDEDKNITANFGAVDVEQFTLTATATDGGTVTTDPTGTLFDAGTDVTVTATADTGYHFTGWTGASESTELSVVITMDENKAVTANFAKDVDPGATTFTLTLTAGDNGSVTPDPVAPEYAKDATVIIEAIPDNGFKFAGWTGVATGNELVNPLTITMDSDKTITATFALIEPETTTYTLTLTATEGGTVAPDGATIHDENTQVEITATAAEGYTFTAWTGVPEGDEATNPLTITMDGDKTIEATFTADEVVVFPDPALYKLTTKKATLTVADGFTSGVVTLTLTGGTDKSSIKIQRQKKEPKKRSTKAGIIYLDDLQLISELNIVGAFGKITCDAEVEALTSDGAIKSITTKIANIASITAMSVGTIKMTALRDDKTEAPTKTDIVTTGAGDMKLTLSGVVLENLNTTQACKYIKLASKAWKDKETKAKNVSLGGAEGEIDAAGAKSITAKGASIACDLIRVGADITNLKASSKKLNKIDYAATLGKPVGEPLMQVLAPNIKTIAGTAAVNGVFTAGFDTEGNPTYTGAIKSITTKAGPATGAAHISPSAKAIKFKPSQGDFEVLTAAPAL